MHAHTRSEDKVGEDDGAGKVATDIYMCIHIYRHTCTHTYMHTYIRTHTHVPETTTR